MRKTVPAASLSAKTDSRARRQKIVSLLNALQRYIRNPLRTPSTNCFAATVPEVVCHPVMIVHEMHHCKVIGVCHARAVQSCAGLKASVLACYESKPP